MAGTGKKDVKLILIAMILGLVVGLIVHYTDTKFLLQYIKPLGTIFIKLLKMVIVPLVLSSIFMAIVNLGRGENLGKMGSRSFFYYFATTAIAVFWGIVFVNLISPGVGADLSGKGVDKLSATMQAKVQGTKGVFATCIDVLVDAVPSNPIAAFADMKVLQIIVIAILFGLITLKLKDKSKPVVGLMESLECISLELTHWIMKFAPIGVFVLMVDIMAKAGFAAIVSLAKYMLTVLIGLFVHAVLLLLFASFKLKRSPINILRDLSMPLLTAFSTASSAATLPVTMVTVEEKLGVKQDTAKFVLPLGATINMDGTALYESVAAIFIAQAYGIDLGVGAQLVIFLTASLAAVGAAAIPGAGLVTMSIVLTAVGLPLEGIGIILAVDRILDMFRTTVNVLGDCVGTVYVDSAMKKA